MKGSEIIVTASSMQWMVRGWKQRQGDGPQPAQDGVITTSPLSRGSTISTVVQVHAALSADEMRRWSGSHSLAHASPPHPWLQLSEESGKGGAGWHRIGVGWWRPPPISLSLFLACGMLQATLLSTRHMAMSAWKIRVAPKNLWFPGKSVELSLVNAVLSVRSLLYGHLIALLRIASCLFLRLFEDFNKHLMCSTYWMSYELRPAQAWHLRWRWERPMEEEGAECVVGVALEVGHVPPINGSTTKMATTAAGFWQCHTTLPSLSPPLYIPHMFPSLWLWRQCHSYPLSQTFGPRSVGITPMLCIIFTSS